MTLNQSVATTHLTFTAVFEPAEEGGYVVTFPAIPNLATRGETLDEARAMAEDCLRGYLEALAADGRPLPEGEPAREAMREAITVDLATAEAKAHSPRQAGIRREWQIPDDLFLEPADKDELRAADGAGRDALGRSRRRR